MANRARWMLLVLLAAGCGSGRVGEVDVCADGGCDAPPSGSALLRRQFSVKMLPELPTTWVKRLPVLTPDDTLLVQGTSFLRLSAAPGSGPWLFWVSAADHALHVAALGVDASLLERALLPAPDALPALEGRPPLLVSEYSAADYVAGASDTPPACKVFWPTACASDGCSGFAAGRFEKLLMGERTTAAPARYALDEPNDDVLRNASGELYRIVSGAARKVSKLAHDASEPLWTQSDFGAVDAELLTGSLLAGGRLALLSASSLSPSLQLNLLDDEGRVDSHTLETAVRDRRYTLLAAAGEPVVVVTDLEADLHVIRTSAGVEHVLDFLRESFSLLELQAAAADPAGRVYVGTQSGERGAARPTLCRVSANDEGSCMVLSQLPGPDRDGTLRWNEIVAQDGGVIYARFGAWLARLQFPD